MEDIDKMTQTERDKQTVVEIEREYRLSVRPSGVKALWPAPMSPTDYQNLLAIAQRGIQYREAVERFLAKGEEGGGADGLYEAAFQLSDEIDAIKEVSDE